MDEPVDVYPEGHPVYNCTNLVGRLTSTAGARRDGGQPPGLIRRFLRLDTSSTRVLGVVAFPRLQEIKYLDEEDLLIAWLTCFFCE